MKRKESKRKERKEDYHKPIIQTRKKERVVNRKTDLSH
jgi:hypothetical protein